MIGRNSGTPNKSSLTETLAVGTATAGLAIAFFAPPRSLATSRPTQEAPLQEKTAAETFKNIQVLKDIPASELMPAMRYITVSLDVGCEFCHDPHHFDTDDKPEKKTARKMMQMMFSINQDSFRGKRQVTCYTCHRGSKKPVTTPSLPSELAENALSPRSAARAPEGGSEVEAEETPSAREGQPAPGGIWPPADQILAKYVQAVGGEKGIARVHTLVEKGTMVVGARNLTLQVAIERKTPDKAITAVEMPKGIMAHGFDGKAAWAQRGNDVEPVVGSDFVQEKRWAAFYPGADISTYYTRLQVDGIDKIDGQDAYRVMAWPAAGAPEKLYFDQKTGFLLRVTSRIESPLGALPKQIDYSDYRPAGGIRVPAKITIVELNGTTVFQFDDLEANRPIDDSRFAMPLPQVEGK
jgi:photosynthetic reaction center cytochrome c subunit